jgi:L-alanine-DL-glutamate epimerase-like enolase superfamily enzyme
MMQIAAVEAIPVVVPKDRPSSSSLGTFDSAKAGILRVQTDEGIEGIGEVSMLWHGGGSSLCHDINTRLASAFVGDDPSNIVRLHRRLEELCQFG